MYRARIARHVVGLALACASNANAATSSPSQDPTPKPAARTNACVDREDELGARGGILGLQVHSGGATEVRFRDLKLEVLGTTSSSR